MNILHKRSLPFIFPLSAVLAYSVSQPPAARGQVVQNNVGAPFVFPNAEQIELGPTLDVIPYVLSDGFTVNLTIIPTLTEFVGYENPNQVLTSGIVLPVGSVLVPTVLPEFRVRQVISTVNVWDGQTVVLGGLIADSTQSIKDKVPILGDLPFVGKLFRSESKNTTKDNLVIFVTPTIIDPAGNRMHSEEEMPFAQTSFPTQPAAPTTPTVPAGTMPAPGTTPPATMTPAPTGAPAPAAAKPEASTTTAKATVGQ